MKPLTTAYCTALLLTASVESAEAAVLEAIQMSDSDNPVHGISFRDVIARAVDPSREVQARHSVNQQSGGPAIPDELNAVLRLSPHLRHCFVLRMLLNFSRRLCAEILHLQVHQVDRYTCEALASLPSLRERAEQLLTWRFSIGEAEVCCEQT